MKQRGRVGTNCEKKKKKKKTFWLELADQGSNPDRGERFCGPLHSPVYIQLVLQEKTLEKAVSFKRISKFSVFHE